MKSLISKAGAGLTTLAGTTLYGYTLAMAQSGGGSGFINANDNPALIQGATGGKSGLRELVLTVVNFFLGFLGLLAVLMVIYGGVLMLTSGGGDGYDKGKKILTQAAIGLIVILLSFAFVSTILTAGAGQA